MRYARPMKMYAQDTPYLPDRRHVLLAAVFSAVSIPSGVLAASATPATKTRKVQPGGITWPLKPGQYVWLPELAPAGPLVVLVSLDEQVVHVYRNGIAIGLSTISSGREGYDTPTGVFTILQKSKDHKSNIYDDAPMPYMQRLTWDGIALHGGSLPGYPASHGCVRLPLTFAEKLFSVTKRGDTVVVADTRVNPDSTTRPSVLAPIATDGKPLADSAAFTDEDFWDDNVAPAGPVSVLVSLAQRRVFVLRNGIIMGAATLTIAPELKFSGVLLYVMTDQYEDTASSLDPTQRRHRWTVYPVQGKVREAPWLEKDIHAPPDFMKRLYGLLTPGTTLVVTSHPAIHALPSTPGAAPTERVLESDNAKR